MLTGWRTLHLLETTSPSLPALAYLHRLAAISATGLFLILWFTRDKIFVTLAGTVLSLAGILLILAAAGLEAIWSITTDWEHSIGQGRRSRLTNPFLRKKIP